MKRIVFFNYSFYPHISCLAAISLLTLACIIPAFCDPIRDAGETGNLADEKTPPKADLVVFKVKVTNAKGQPVVGAKITFQLSNREYTGNADGSGENTFLWLGMPDALRIIVHAAGYQPEFVEKIKPKFPEETQFDFKLNPGDDKIFPFEKTSQDIKKTNLYNFIYKP